MVKRKAQTEHEEAAEHVAVTVGTTVLYVLGTQGPGNSRSGEIRPAMVVRVWEGQEPPLVQLQVFLDGTNDDPIDGAALTWRTSVRYSADHEPGTWHLPAEVAADELAETAQA